MPQKDIPGFEGLYSIDEEGKIISYKSSKGPKELAHQSGTKGYRVIRLYDKERKGHTLKVHRLVAELFIPNPYGLPQVDHIDNDKLNNSVINLRWVNNQVNCEKALAKTFLLTHKNGELLTVYNLNKWCRDNKFNIQTFYKMSYGQRKSAYGYNKMEAAYS